MVWLLDFVLREDEDGYFKNFFEVNGKDMLEVDRFIYILVIIRLSLGKKWKVNIKIMDLSFNIILMDFDV